MASFDIFHASHDEVKAGLVDHHHKRVVITDDIPHHEAAQLAALLVMAIHGGMVTRIMPRI